MHKGDTPEEMTKREGRFLREVSMLSRVQHKNLVKVYFCRLDLLFPRQGDDQEGFVLKSISTCFIVYRGLPRTCHGGGD